MSTLEKDIPLHVRAGARSVMKSALLELMKSRKWTPPAVERMILWGTGKLSIAGSPSFKEWLETDEQSLEECVQVLAAVVEEGVEKKQDSGSSRSSALPPDLQRGSPLGPRVEEPYPSFTPSFEIAEGEEGTEALEWHLKQATFQAACASVIEDVIEDPDKGPAALAAFEVQLRRMRAVVEMGKAE